MLSRFKVNHSRWLSQAIIITLDEELTDPSPSKMGRPTLSYTQAEMRLKHKLANDLASDTDLSTQHLLHAASVSAEKGNSGKDVDTNGSACKHSQTKRKWE